MPSTRLVGTTRNTPHAPVNIILLTYNRRIRGPRQPIPRRRTSLIRILLTFRQPIITIVLDGQRVPSGASRHLRSALTVRTLTRRRQVPTSHLDRHRFTSSRRYPFTNRHIRINSRPYRAHIPHGHLRIPDLTIRFLPPYRSNLAFNFHTLDPFRLIR